MENLNHDSDHLANLIVQERLALQVKPNKFKTIGIFLISNLQCLDIHVPELTCLHGHHKTLGSHLVSLDLLGVVVVLFGAEEALPAFLESLLLGFCHSVPLDCLQELGSNVAHVSVHMFVDIFHFVFSIRFAEDLLDSSCHLGGDLCVIFALCEGRVNSWLRWRFKT